MIFIRNGKKAIPIPIGNCYNGDSRIHAQERTIKSVIPLHFHDFIELELVTDGFAYHQVNGKEIPYEKGFLIISRYSDYHYIKPIERIKLLNVSFEPNVIDERIMRELESNPALLCTNLNDEDYSDIEHFINIIIKETASEHTEIKYISRIIECIILKLLGLVSVGEPSPKIFPIQEALSYLRAHFAEDPSAELIAKMLNYHPKYFCSVFKREMGVTYSKYLTKLKIKYSKTLLTITDFSLDYICINSGFGSMVQFRKAFRDYCGVTPLQYRNNSKIGHIKN